MNYTEIKNVLSQIYKKDMVCSLMIGRENMSAEKIRKAHEIAPTIPLEAWLDIKGFLAKQKEQES